MRKIVRILLIALIVGGTYLPYIPPASAYTFINSPPPKVRMDGNTPIYYLDLKSPDNPNGRVPASYKHYNASSNDWERLANSEFALRDEVWRYVWEWRSQTIDTSNSFITPMESLTWNGDLQSSIDISLRNILRANPDYYAKEVMVYPIHTERSYPISIADALLKQSRNNYENSISDISNIDKQWSNIPERNQPYVWPTGADAALPWKTYLPTHKVYEHADYPGGTRFGNYDMVYNEDSTGRSRWLNSPNFWIKWAGDTNDESRKSFITDIREGNYYGRAHPMYYTPENDEYMRDMQYWDWSFSRVTWGLPTASCPSDPTCEYPYANWHAMVSEKELTNSKSSYKIQVYLVKRAGEEEGEVGEMCPRVISPPSAGAQQQADKMDANTSGFIKADTRGNEKFNVLDGIPTSESLYANAFAKEYLFKNTFTQMSGDVTYTVKVKKTYNLTWSTRVNRPDGTYYYTPHSDQTVVEKTYQVKRPYYYWQIDNLEVNGLESATMSNYALPNGSITMSPNGYSPPSVSASNDDDVEEHVFPAECENVNLGSQNINGGTSRPAVPNENWQTNAEGAVTKNKVKNDSVLFNGSVIMDDTKVEETAPTPSTIPESPMTNQNVFYRSGMVISNSLLNKADTPSSGNINYNLIKGIKGGSAKTYPINGINTVTVHTPTVIYANVSNDSGHNQRTKPDPVRKAVILDRPFTIMMPTSGQHLNIQGYGNRDYAKYISRKQVRFPFDVYHYNGGTQGTFVPANTWVDIPVDDLSSAFYTPVWVDEGSYDVLFRSFAVNSPSTGFTTEQNANLNLANHVATDVIPIDVIGRLYDFRITDIADYNWENVFRVSPNNYRHTGNYYWVQDKGIDGALRGNNSPFYLPIMPGSHPDYKNTSIKTGYHFKFDLKTKGNMFNQGDGIRITPTFYFVNKDGSNRREVDLYYKNENQSFVKIGSAQDEERRHVKLVERLRNVPESEIEAAADYAFDHYSNITTTIKNRYIQEYLNDAKDKTYVGQYSWMILPSKLKTHIGPSSIPPNASVDQQRAVASIHQWYGEYSLPAAVYTVPKGTNLAEVGRMEPLTDKSSVFLKDGYIVVNFNLETIKNQDTENPYLQYIHAPLANQWKIEGYKNSRVDPYGNSFSLLDGDVVFYHGDLSSYDDFQSSVTH